jgi:hypothetical protein
LLLGGTLRDRSAAVLKADGDAGKQGGEERRSSMRSLSLRRTTVLILVMVFLVPGLLQAGTMVRLNSPASEAGFFNVVWNLLTVLWVPRCSDSSSTVKNGGQADPNGSGGGSTGGGTGGAGGNSATGGEDGGDNGGQADPNG